jgi:hypothetical protein
MGIILPTLSAGNTSDGETTVPVPEILHEYRFVRGDTGPQIKLVIHQSEQDIPEDLRDGTVVLTLFNETTRAQVVSRPCYINPETGADGVAIIAWEEGDLDQDPGFYIGELEITLSSGVRETLFDQIRLYIRDTVE